MTVEQLRKALEGKPANMWVMIEATNPVYPLSLLQKAEERVVNFSSDGLKAKDTCLVLTDEF